MCNVNYEGKCSLEDQHHSGNNALYICFDFCYETTKCCKNIFAEVGSSLNAVELHWTVDCTGEFFPC